MLNETLFLNEEFNNFGEYLDILREEFEKEYFTESFSLTRTKVDKMIKDFNLNKRNNIIALNRMGIKCNKLLDYSNQKAKELYEDIRKQSYSKQGCKNIAKLSSKAISDIKTNIIDGITNNTAEFIKDTTSNETIQTAILLMIVVSVNTLFSVLFDLLFGPVGGLIIHALIVAPIVEEMGKLVAVKVEKDHSGSRYTTTFNIIEMHTYMSRMIKSGTSVVVAFGVRIPAMILHVVNTYIISNGYKKDIQEGKSKENAGSIATMITMCIHGLFNAIAIMI